MEYDEDQTKKRVFTQIQSVFLPRFYALISNLKGGKPWLNFAYYSDVFIHYWQPKGGRRGMAQWSFPKYAPEN